MQKFILALIVATASLSVQAQTRFSRADSLRGALRPERTCFDVTYYHLTIDVNPSDRAISGSTEMHFRVVENTTRIQVDLFKNLSLDSVVCNGLPLSFERDENAVFISFPDGWEEGMAQSLKMYYHGRPTVAVNAPWDGGFTWSRDQNNKYWIAVSCEGIGASLWWPNKDHLSDEPDSMRITASVPKDLTCIANGNLEESYIDGEKAVFTWKVSYSINNYNVTLNIGDYVNIHDVYKGVEATYDLDYYVLSYNKPKAEKQFKQVKPMLDIYEKYLGPYPFPKDGYALVETPYLGMEHQSAIAYGNKFINGYLGTDINGSGIMMKFDYIIIHETGHEYWGNSVSMKDAADMWIHEGFCTYSEIIYVEFMYGKEEAEKYASMLRYSIQNDKPVIGNYDVNNEGSGDMYYKGAFMLHTLRTLVNNDELWWNTIRDIQKNFREKTTTTEEIIAYMNQKLGKDYTTVLDQYLRETDVPVLDYRVVQVGPKFQVKLKWSQVIEGFNMPVRYKIGKGDYQWAEVGTNDWTEIVLTKKEVEKLAFDINNMYFKLKQ